MKYLIVVQNKRVLSINWETFCNPEAHKLVIITSDSSHKELLDAQLQNHFHKIITVQDFKTNTLIEKFNAFISEEKINDIPGDILIATNDEPALIPCAEVRQHFKLSGNKSEDLMHFRNKLNMKDKLKNHKELFPKFIAYDHQKYLLNKEEYLSQIEEYLKYPIFIKPVDDGGSRRTGTINNRQELSKWCEHYTEGSFEMDEFVVGTLYHCDSIIQDGKVKYFLAGRNNFPCAEFLNGKPNGTIPLIESDEIFITLKGFNERVLQLLSPLPNGCTHMEVYITDKGEYKFLEIAARSPGAHIPDVYKTWKGIDFRAAQLKLQLGLSLDLTEKLGPYQAWIWYPYKPGIMSKINPLSDNFQSKTEITWRKKCGDLLEKPKDLIDYTCSMMITNSNYETLNIEFTKLSDLQMYESTPIANSIVSLGIRQDIQQKDQVDVSNKTSTQPLETIHGYQPF